MYPNDISPDAMFQPAPLQHEGDAVTSGTRCSLARIGSAGARSRGVGLAIISEDGAWMAVNGFLCRALGVCEEQLIGRQARDFVVPHPGLRDGWITHQGADLDACVKNGYVPLCLQLRLSGGALRGLQGTCEEVDASDGGGYFVTLLDVGSLTTTEQKPCDGAQAARTTLAIVAHELRNPLTTVLLSADLLQASKEKCPSEQTIARITNNAEQALQIADDLVDVSRWSQDSGLDLVLQETDLGALVTQLREDYALSHPARTITIQEAGNLWGTWDPSRLAQALSNLISNALTHSASGDDPVEVQLYGSHDKVTIDVCNGGDAIPKSDLDQLFDPLFTTKARQFNRHLGLGLFVVKRIVDSHYGQISVTSSPATGTCFAITLPRRVSPPLVS